MRFSQVDRVFNCLSWSLSLAANERSSALGGPLPPAERPAFFLSFSFLSLLVYPNFRRPRLQEGN